MTTIYGLRSEGVIVYVGQTEKPRHRATWHRCRFKKLGLPVPEMVVLCECSKGAADAAEVKWIAKYAGPGLLNKTAGNVGWEGRRRNHLFFSLTDDEMRRVSKAAAKLGMADAEWSRQAVLDAAR